VNLDLVGVAAFNGLVEDLGRPAIQTAVDDRERRIECPDELGGRPWVVEVVVPVGIVVRVRPRRRLRARLTDHGTQPVGTHRRRVPDRGPDRISLR
jgi:hypothetical protein